MLVLVPGLFRNLPQPALAAVVITAALSLADLPGTARLWRQRRTEFMLSIAAFLGVALLGVLPGIAIAVALSILNVFRRTWWPYETVLGQVDGLPGYHDIRSYPQADHLPGLVIVRFDAPLIFANATTFRDQIRKLAAAEPRPRWILLAAEPLTDVDTTAADMLEDLDQDLNDQRNQPGLRRAQGPRTPQDRAVRPRPLVRARATSSPPSRRPSPRSARRPERTGSGPARPPTRPGSPPVADELATRPPAT